jgi:hypothetical protein
MKGRPNEFTRAQPKGGEKRAWNALAGGCKSVQKRASTGVVPTLPTSPCPFFLGPRRVQVDGRVDPNSKEEGR